MTETKKIFITGGTGTIGCSLIETFCRKGHTVFFQYSTNDKRAEELCDKFLIKSFKIDFTSKFIIPELDIDILINNTGINICDTLTHEVSQELFDKTIQVNLTTPFKLSKFYLPKMIERNWGRIININSIYGLRGVDYNSPYNISKHGLSGLTKSIAKEYAVNGITCNEICPGAIDSELMNRIADRVFADEGIEPKDFLKQVSEKYPAKRLVQPNEVSAVALFLASNEAAYVNGSSIPVDGGLIC